VYACWGGELLIGKEVAGVCHLNRQPRFPILDAMQLYPVMVTLTDMHTQPLRLFLRTAALIMFLSILPPIMCDIGWSNCPNASIPLHSGNIYA
jgi:hypothetical protein